MFKVVKIVTSSVPPWAHLTFIVPINSVCQELLVFENVPHLNFFHLKLFALIFIDSMDNVVFILLSSLVIERGFFWESLGWDRWVRR